ncbi:MAG: hypothetical protein WDO73_07250 [Ignavibacteriota bacterium]
MNQMVIEHLDPAAWGANTLGSSRPIAAIFTRMRAVTGSTGKVPWLPSAPLRPTIV